MEILDEIMMQAVGVHILEAVPVKKTVTRIVPDQKTLLIDYAASMNIRSQSQTSSVFDPNDLASSKNNKKKKIGVKGNSVNYRVAGLKSAISRKSAHSTNSRSQPNSPHNFKN